VHGSARRGTSSSPPRRQVVILPGSSHDWGACPAGCRDPASGRGWTRRWRVGPKHDGGRFWRLLRVLSNSGRGPEASLLEPVAAASQTGVADVAPVHTFGDPVYRCR